MSEKLKILVVDDSNLIRFKVKSIFEDYDVDVLELNNADDLFRFAKRYQQVNLIILDINLPDMNGIAALEKFQKDSSWMHVPVVMLTSRADRLTVQKALQSGAVGYIRKPFTEEEVLDRVQKILGTFPLAGDNKNIWSRDEIAKNINLEVERAKLGNYSISVIMINPAGLVDNTSDIYELVKLKEDVFKELHQFDTAVITTDHQILLILPFTNSEGAAAIIDKINKNQIHEDTVKLDVTSVTFPDICKSMDEIIDSLSLA